MATVSGISYNPLLKKSWKSAADYSAAITNVAVYLTAENTITRCGANAKGNGIMVNKPNTGEAAEVITHGTAPMKCGTAIALNDWIKSDGLGEADVADTDKDKVIAQALMGGAHDDIIEVRVVSFTLSV